MFGCRWTKWGHFAGLEAEVFCRWRFAGRVCPVAGLPKSGVCTDGGGRTRSKTAQKWVFLGQKWPVFGSNSSAYKWTGAFSFRCSVPGLDPSRFEVSHPSRKQKTREGRGTLALVRRNRENQGWGTRRLRFVVSHPSQKARRMGHPVLWGCQIPENQGWATRQAESRHATLPKTHRFQEPRVFNMMNNDR